VRTDSVLIVDDTPVNLKLVRVLLSRQGFDVRTASTAEEALEMVQSFRPSLVLADIQLPGMDGLEMTRRLKADPKTSGTVVLALTAFAMKGDEQKAFEAGCDGYITKPIDTRSFPALIRQYLSKSTGSAAEAPAAPPATTERQTQQAFLSEGMQQSGRLISSLGSGFDTVEALSIVQRWASNAGSAGYPEISHYARELETLLRQNGRGSMVRTRELLVRLARAFAESMG
jgi:two-component system cell cycle response regulator DivK